MIDKMMEQINGITEVYSVVHNNHIISYDFSHIYIIFTATQALSILLKLLERGNRLTPGRLRQLE